MASTTNFFFGGCLYSKDFNSIIQYKAFIGGGKNMAKEKGFDGNFIFEEILERKGLL